MSDSSSPGPKRILIVDDHPVVRAGYRALISRHGDLAVCGEAGNMADAMQLVRERSPHLVIVDILLDGCNGLELCKQLSTKYPSLRLLVVSAHEESLYAVRTLRSGAKGFIHKDEALQRLIEGIRTVLAGRLFLSESVTHQLLSRNIGAERPSDDQPLPMSDLSDRELEVFEWIGRGLTTRQIAAQLHLSPKTVEAYRANLKRRLKLHSGDALNRFAMHWMLEKQIP